MMDGGHFSSPVEAEYFASLNTLSKKNKSKNKRRFSDEQVKFLENIFESESKLEPRKKMQLAREIGLQPRQVAIWFQNKRARWKSKQIEQDYSILQASYNTLASQFETLKKEKQSLLTQLQKLNYLLEKSQKGSESCGDPVAKESNIDGNSNRGDHIKCEFEVKPCPSPEISEHRFAVLSDDDSSIRAEYLRLDGEPDLINMVEPADGSMTSTENWGSLDSDCLLHQPSSSFHWWDFWS